jgi:hypothetical protein
LSHIFKPYEKQEINKKKEPALEGIQTADRKRGFAYDVYYSRGLIYSTVND